MDRGEQPPALNAADPDGDSLIYTMLDGALPAGLTLNPDGTWSGTILQTGTFVVTIKSCDPFGACTGEVLTITVTRAALPPTDTLDEVGAGSPVADLRIITGLAFVLLGLTAAMCRPGKTRTCDCGAMVRVGRDDEHVDG